MAAQSDRHDSGGGACLEMSLTAFCLVCLGGAVLGSAFKVQYLFPTAGVALLCTAIIGVWNSNGGAEVIVTSISIAATLQIGYIGGSVVRALVDFTAAPAAPRILTRAAASHGLFPDSGDTGESFHPYAYRASLDVDETRIRAL